MFSDIFGHLYQILLTNFGNWCKLDIEINLRIKLRIKEVGIMVANTNTNENTQENLTPNDKKIALWELRQYKVLLVEIEELQAEKAALESGIIGAVNLGVRSKNSGISDPTAVLAGRLEYFATEMGEAMNNLIALRMKIEKAIETLEPLERVVVRMRYFQGKNAEEIGEKLAYSPRTITRYHDKILKKIC